MDIQLVDADEWKLISQKIDRDFGRDITKMISGSLVPVSIKRRSGTALYLVPDDWISFLEKPVEGYRISSLGLWLGEIVNKRVRLSVAVMGRIARVTESYIVVSGQGAESFTYGRSILKESVSETGTGLERRQRVVVLNEEKECLGLAMLSVDSDKIPRLANDDLVAKNIVDIGWFIRRLS